ncbi:hypothetical protein CDIK_2922 [Cucumispora dikerogammari]|nr:hypothetical protein CDIK_2922 [Cucumispora dikerogammari]
MKGNGEGFALPTTQALCLSTVEDKETFSIPITQTLCLSTVEDKDPLSLISLYHYDLLEANKLIEIECITKVNKKIYCKTQTCEDSIAIIEPYISKLEDAILIETQINEIINQLKSIFPTAVATKLNGTLKFFLTRFLFIEINDKNFKDIDFRKYALMKYLKSSHIKYNILIEFMKHICLNNFNNLQFSANLLWKDYLICKLDVKRRNETCPLMFLINNFQIMLDVCEPALDSSFNLISKIEISGNIFLELKFEDVDMSFPKCEILKNLSIASANSIREKIRKYLYTSGLCDFAYNIEPNSFGSIKMRGDGYAVVMASDHIIYLKYVDGKYIFFSNKYKF